MLSVAGWTLSTKRNDGSSNVPTSKRDEEFQTIFHLKHEKAIDDFSCACQTEQDSVQRQGRMYITENYICFYSVILGAYTKVIKFEDVISVSKKNSVILIPNAIEIATQQSKFFFSSFIYRNRAYSVLRKYFYLKKGLDADEIPDETDDEDGDGHEHLVPPPTTSSPPAHDTKDTPNPSTPIEVSDTKMRTNHNKPPTSAPLALATSTDENTEALRPTPPVVSEVESKPDIPQIPPRALTQTNPSSGISRIVMSQGYDPFDADDIINAPEQIKDERPHKPKGIFELKQSEKTLLRSQSLTRLDKPTAEGTQPKTPQSSPSPTETSSKDDQDDEEMKKMENEEKRTDQLLPPTTDNCKHFTAARNGLMFKETFDLSLKEFYINFFLEETHHFTQEYHQKIEYTETEIENWVPSDEKCCNKRNLKFRVPLKAALGPKSTRVEQTQFVRFKNANQMVFATNSISKDVPYGDTFIVETKWNIDAAPNQAYKIVLSLVVDINFIKTSWMLKSIIEKNVMESTKEYFGGWIEYARAKVQNIIDSRQARVVKQNLKLKQSKQTAIFEEDKIAVPIATETPTIPTLQAEPVRVAPLQSIPSGSSVPVPLQQAVSINIPILGTVDFIMIGVWFFIFMLLLSTFSMHSQLSSLNSALHQQQIQTNKMELRLSFVQMLTAILTQNATNNPGFMKEEWDKFTNGEDQRKGGIGYHGTLSRWKTQISNLQQELESSKKFLSRIGEQLEMLGATEDQEASTINLETTLNGALDDSGREIKSVRDSTLGSNFSLWVWVERIILTCVALFTGVAVQKFFL